MNFKLILHGLMLTTSALAFLSSPLAFSDDTITLKKEKGHDYIKDDKRLLDVPEYVKATGKSKDAFNQAQKGEINSHRDFYKEKLSDDTVSMKHIDDALEVVTSVKREGHQPTHKEFSGAHWAADEKFCIDQLGLKEGEILTGDKIQVGIFVNAAAHSKKDMTEKELKRFSAHEDTAENRAPASSNGIALRSLATQTSPKDSVELHHDRELLERNAKNTRHYSIPWV